MANSSYSKEEIEDFIKNQPTEEERMSGYQRYWGMDTEHGVVWIPLEKLKLDHLRNIVKWVNANSRFYSFQVIENMEAEYKRRYDNASEAEKILYGK